MSRHYKDAGVDIEAGYSAVKLIKPIAQSTYTDGVVSGVGGFGAMFMPDLTGYSKPCFVSGTDSAGTKLRVAIISGKLDTIGIDCVAMCVNDVICQGAKPLFFLDYLAVGKLKPQVAAEVVKGIAEGCKQSGCALIGGETAELPGFYAIDDFDVAGFAVGLVDMDKAIKKDDVKVGNVLIGLASSGVHTNGFSLVRKVFNIGDKSAEKLNLEFDGIGNLGECLLTPTKIYVKLILDIISQVKVNGIANITGGGFYENIPRMLPDNVSAKIELNSFHTHEIFNLIQNNGNIELNEMYNVFNMGIGMVISADKSDADTIMRIIKEHGETGYIIGEVTKELSQQVVLC